MTLYIRFLLGVGFTLNVIAHFFAILSSKVIGKAQKKIDMLDAGES
jgi:hypothetical protein